MKQFLTNDIFPGSPSLAKEAVAFINVSFSISTHLFSADNRFSSTSVGERLPLPGNALKPSASSSSFQPNNKLASVPMDRPASPAEIPC